MSKIKKKWDLLPDELKKARIEEISTFVNKNSEEEIGMIAAEEYLDFFLEILGEDLYNKGVDDAKALLRKKMKI